MVKTRRVVFVAVLVDGDGEAMTERERETVEEREEDVDDADDLAALVPKMLTRGEPVEMGNNDDESGESLVWKEAAGLRSAQAREHTAVLAWIALDTLWSQESEWVFAPMVIVCVYFTHSAWASWREDAKDFPHALAVFLWLVGANTVWVWMDVLGSSHALLKAWCIVCFAWSILIETVQLSSLVVDIRDVSARDLSDAFESLVILSWAAHDLVNFVYYSFSGTTRFYILFMWWLFSVIIIVQSTYYLLVQIRIFCSRPRSHSVEYALALFAWSVGVMLWEFGDFYAPEDQDPENIFEEPTNSRNMRWYCFWTIGDNSLIGIGAVILNNAKIGKNCIIGAKALITENKEIPDNSLVVGAPGKIVRKVTEEEVKLLTKNAKHYQDNWKKYSKSIF